MNEWKCVSVWERKQAKRYFWGSMPFVAYCFCLFTFLMHILKRSPDPNNLPKHLRRSVWSKNWAQYRLHEGSHFKLRSSPLYFTVASLRSWIYRISFSLMLTWGGFFWCSLRTTLCVRFKAEVLACGCILLASRRLKVRSFNWNYQQISLQLFSEVIG